MIKIKNILLHEYLWIVLLSIILLRTIMHNSILWSLFVFLCLFFTIININIKNIMHHFIFYIILMPVVFLSLRYISPIINSNNKKDALLYQIDCYLSGDFIGLITNYYSPLWLTEIFAFFYLLLFLQLVFFFIYFFKKKELTQPFFTGLMSIYAIGFLGYIFVPATGAYDFLANKFTIPLKGYIFFWFLDKSYTTVSNLTDVFPSLHCGVSCFILLFNAKFDKKQFKIWLIPTLLLWISTIYLHYHYLIDCIVGILLAILCFIVSLKKTTMENKFK